MAEERIMVIITFVDNDKNVCSQVMELRRGSRVEEQEEKREDGHQVKKLRKGDDDVKRRWRKDEECPERLVVIR